MKISELITRLDAIQGEYGDIDVALTSPLGDSDGVCHYFDFFIIPEHCDDVDEPTTASLRTWPY